MQETTIEAVRRKARSWQAQGKAWHFHMLTPGCVFNEHQDRHAFVLENTTDGETYVVYSDEPYLEADRELVMMLHGDRILDRDEGATDSGREDMQAVLQRAKELNRNGLFWHHHMLFPDCVFNAHKGKWNIFFEDEDRDEVIEVLYDEEPVGDLRRVEILFWEGEQRCGGQRTPKD